MRTDPLDRLAMILATWFGCGYAPLAPGTVGSAAAVLVAWVLHRFAAAEPVTCGVLALAVLIPGVWAAERAAATTETKDPGLVVVDEVIGQWVALSGATALNAKSWIAGFVLFRLFDIWKPFPIRRLEQLPGGTGIVADDVMAGVYAALVLLGMGWCNLY